MASGISLEDTKLLHFLENDPRPTFVLDTTAKHACEDCITPIYSNPAIISAQSGDLLELITTKPNGDDFDKFRTWVNQIADNPQKSRQSSQFTYLDYVWTRVTFDGRWILISGSPTNINIDNDLCPPSINVTNNHSTNSHQTSQSSGTNSIQHLGKPHSSFDWTDEQPPMNTTAHIDFARSIDWASTPLGPMSTWSTQLRSSANLVMQDPRPAVIFWGPDLIMIYNEAYVEIVGSLHPGCMGNGARITLAKVTFDHFLSIIERNLAGETVEETDTPVFIDRAGFLEETYFSMKFMPVFDHQGVPVGHYQTVIETTKQVILQRRLSTLLQLSDEIPRARDVPSYWNLATQVLSINDKDVPFALIYSVEYDDIFLDGTSSISMHSRGNNKQCILRGSIGLDRDSPARPSSLEFEENDGFMPYFRQAMESLDPITVQFDQDTLGTGLVQGIILRGFGDPCRAAAVFAINPTSSTQDVVGFMVIGLNPRTPYDDDYQRFILVASRLLSTSLTAILLHEEEISRQESAIAQAETMKIELMERLLTTQKELERNNKKFQKFAERCDVGIFILGLDGIYTYRNEAWYTMCTPDTYDGDVEEAWNEIVDDDYARAGRANFETVVRDKTHMSFEILLKRTLTVSNWTNNQSDAEKQPMWVLCSVFPELSDDGDVVEIVGCITDISRQKWGEKMQAARASDAQESKRQLENFIDTTSHEMRNPLSAIIQCADGIITAHRSAMDTPDHNPKEVADTCIDAAETVVQCSQHMKCIVDDVLTMSKLDSGLLIITPVDVQPETIAKNAIKMFEGEAKSADVDLKFELEKSWYENSIHWVSLDPTRLLQILINLITNAIKFTRLESTRQVTISMGLTRKRPQESVSGQVTYNQTLSATHAPRPLPQSLQVDWAKGQVVYVSFTVTDTGRGLSETEKDLLFARFSQASPRTHIHYGGSGLGLFICRRLTEMHGGSIGFASNSGSGSSFSFYIKGRKSQDSSIKTDSNSSTSQNLPTQKIIPSIYLLERKKSTNQTQIKANATKNGASPDGLAIVQGLNVLVVEDNLVNQRVLAKQLRNLNMTVSVANHGGEALEYLLTTKFCSPSYHSPSNSGSSTNEDAKQLDLILMDWEMPVMDGLTCVRRIRELQMDGVVKGHVPVIAVTANVRSEQVQVAMDAGMDDVVSKPFRVLQLCERIGRLFREEGEG